METIDQYLHNLYRIQPDFMYCVSRDFARSCQTPMLVMPDEHGLALIGGCHGAGGVGAKGAGDGVSMEGVSGH